MKLYRAFLWMMIVSLSLAAALGVWALLMPGTSQLQERVLITSLIVGVFCLPAFGCSIVLHRRRMMPVMMLGIGAAGVAVALWMVILWSDLRTMSSPGEEILKTSISVTILTVWAAHFGLIGLTKLSHPAGRFVRIGTIGFMSLFGATLLLGVWFEPDEEWYFRGMGVLLILGVCGTIVTPTLALIELIKSRSTRESIPSMIRIDLTCPRCGSNERIAGGGGRCSSCGLRIVIDVQEPRCACGYLLHKLSGDKCPECGRTIPEADRWHVRKMAPDADEPPNALPTSPPVQPPSQA